MIFLLEYLKKREKLEICMGTAKRHPTTVVFNLKLDTLLDYFVYRGLCIVSPTFCE